MKSTLQKRARSRVHAIQAPAEAVRLRMFTAALLRKLAARIDHLEGATIGCAFCDDTGRRFPFVEPGCRAFEQPCLSYGGKVVAMTPEREKRLTAAKLAMTREMTRISDEHDMSAEEVLALCAFITGGAIAYQDQLAMTSAQAMEIVNCNIVAGNETALAMLNSAGGVPQ